jgi:putative flippase GtrA
MTIKLIKQLVLHPLATISAHKELRYLVAGAASEVIEYVSFLLLLPLTDLLYVSNSISFALGVISGFIFHKTWSFRGEHQFKTHQQFIGYVSLAAVNFVLINLLVGFFVHGRHMSPDLAKLLSIIITVSWTYVLTNLVIFRHRKVEPEPPQANQL